MSGIGTAVVGDPRHWGSAGPNACAVVTLYGPRGGEIGTTAIQPENAREVIARLQAMLDRP